MHSQHICIRDIWGRLGLTWRVPSARQTMTVVVSLVWSGPSHCVLVLPCAGGAAGAAAGALLCPAASLALSAVRSVQEPSSSELDTMKLCHDDMCARRAHVLVKGICSFSMQCEVTRCQEPHSRGLEEQYQDET